MVIGLDSPQYLNMPSSPSASTVLIRSLAPNAVLISSPVSRILLAHVAESACPLAQSQPFSTSDEPGKRLSAVYASFSRSVVRHVNGSVLTLPLQSDALDQQGLLGSGERLYRDAASQVNLPRIKCNHVIFTPRHAIREVSFSSNFHTVTHGTPYPE